MHRQTTRLIKIASCFLVTFAALSLTGCGNHDQAGTGGGTVTQAQMQQNAQKQNEYLKNHPPSPVNAAPATH